MTKEVLGAMMLVSPFLALLAVWWHTGREGPYMETFIGLAAAFLLLIWIGTGIYLLFGGWPH